MIIVIALFFIAWFYFFKKQMGFQSVAHNELQTQDVYNHEKIRNLRHHMDQQENEMNARALNKHEASCEDIFSCSGCFKHEPDSIVRCSNNKIIYRQISVTDGQTFCCDEHKGNNNI